MSSYTYDEGGDIAPFFVLTLCSIFAIPITYNILRPSPELESTGDRIESDFKPNEDDIIQSLKRQRKRRQRKTKRIISAALLWAVIAYTVYIISITQITIPKRWDPYDVLGLSRSATEKEIDRFYKRLAIKYHPDKAIPDVTKNETQEMVNERWIEMTKAHMALTDEEARNNWLLYGNPDGKQSTTMGIAIPEWVIMGNTRWAVIAFYASLLGIFLPYVVGSWWYGTQSKTKDGILLNSAANLFKGYEPDLTANAVFGVVSTADEYKQILVRDKADLGAAKIESLVLASGRLSSKDQARLKAMEDPVARKSLCLLWAYLLRIDLGSEQLNRQKFEVAPTGIKLSGALANTALPFLALRPLLATYHAQQSLVQSLPPDSSPAAQLPHMAQFVDVLQKGTPDRSPISIERLMSLPASIRSQVGMSDLQFSQAVDLAKRLPSLRIEKAFFKVVGDKVITPSAFVQLVIKARVIPPSFQPGDIPPVSEIDLEDPDPEEGDLDALKGRKVATKRKGASSEGGPLEESEKPQSIQPPLAYAPYLATDHAPRWHVFLAETRQNRISVGPFTHEKFDKPIFKADGTPTFEVLTFRCQFNAPPQVHSFKFSVYMICDSYIGMDNVVDVTLDVRDFVELGTSNVKEDEISEPDEDSLAGQLAAMKEGGIAGALTNDQKPVKQSRKAAQGQVDDEDESDTEGEADNTSDTDTETEDEDTGKK